MGAACGRQSRPRLAGARGAPPPRIPSSHGILARRHFAYVCVEALLCKTTGINVSWISGFRMLPKIISKNILGFHSSGGAVAQVRPGAIVERTKVEIKLSSVNSCTSMQCPASSETNQYARACFCSWRVLRFCIAKMYFVFFYGFWVFHGAKKKKTKKCSKSRLFGKKRVGRGECCARTR